jgi:hypothetical protein
VARNQHLCCYCGFGMLEVRDSGSGCGPWDVGFREVIFEDSRRVLGEGLGL